MKYVEFKKFTDENGALPIYLFEGEEVYFREKELFAYLSPHSYFIK